MTEPSRRLCSDPLPQGFVSVPRTVGPVRLSAATVSMGDALQANWGPVNSPSPSPGDGLSSGNHCTRAAVMKVSCT